MSESPYLSSEVAVLGAMILEPSARRGALGQLTPDMFAREAHRQVFEAIAAMHRGEVHVDTVTLTDQLATSGRLDEVGGAGAVCQLTDPTHCPSPSAWEVYARIVAREGRRRHDRGRYLAAIERLDRGDDPDRVAAELGVAHER